MVESDFDLDEIDDLVGTYGLDPVLLVAQATTRTESLERTRKLIPSAIARGYRVSPRLHILLWGDERGR